MGLLQDDAAAFHSAFDVIANYLREKDSIGILGLKQVVLYLDSSPLEAETSGLVVHAEEESNSAGYFLIHVLEISYCKIVCPVLAQLCLNYAVVPVIERLAAGKDLMGDYQDDRTIWITLRLHPDKKQIMKHSNAEALLAFLRYGEGVWGE